MALLGAIAGVRFTRGTHTYAEREGLFGIHNSGKVAEIVDEPTFKPKLWRPR